jgi:hypothetical protein
MPLFSTRSSGAAPCREERRGAWGNCINQRWCVKERGERHPEVWVCAGGGGRVPGQPGRLVVRRQPRRRRVGGVAGPAAARRRRCIDSGGLYWWACCGAMVVGR